ncbi:MBL fold metallo-hydrolase [Nocardioides zeae]|uniref:MBL fold metallo-hydrolase n=1 Tax=Nocardioides imazamoxiresistens TaxID=3231893 RepID=A0ABU3Q138_9ACTN|nr:MBL fold metallo-hydrolase [Nocardioides zeae]MDT9595217.1 MBL fold metallo-hydrolase [Nocardioides zeae]
MGRSPATTTFVEVADRVWVARHEWYDVNVTLVAGGEGALLVDTLASEHAAAGLRDEVRRVLGTTPLVAVVDTHEHHDHVLGNATLLDAWPDALLVGHEEAARRIPEVLPAQLARAVADGHPRAEEMAASRVLAPTTTFSLAHAVQLGDRLVEVVHPGRGHTGGDVVLRVADADVVVAGDLVEAADDPGAAVPAYGDDSFPLEWPATVETVLGLVTPTTRVVPGHGPVVDRSFVLDQHGSLAALAAQVVDLAATGVGPDEATAAGTWPFPVERLGAAVARGYAALPPGARRLPLV